MRMKMGKVLDIILSPHSAPALASIVSYTSFVSLELNTILIIII